MRFRAVLLVVCLAGCLPAAGCAGLGGSDAPTAKPKRSEGPQDARSRGQRMVALAAEAFALTPDKNGKVPEEGLEKLRRVAAEYEALVKEDPPGLDRVVLRLGPQLYAPGALNEPRKQLEAARLFAERSNESLPYLMLAITAAARGDQRTVDLAGQKALELAPSSEEAEIRQQLKVIQRTVAP